MKDFLPSVITWFRLDEHVRRLKIQVGLIENQIEVVELNTRPYKVYTALLAQSGTNAPVVTVLENTLGGEPVWTRAQEGRYLATLEGAFILDKTWTSITMDNNIDTVYKTIYRMDLNNVEVQTYTDLSSLAFSDTQLFETPIEIRIYN